MMIKALLKFYEDPALLHDHTAAASIQHRGPLKFFNPQKLTSGDCNKFDISLLQQTSLHEKFKNHFGLSAQATPQTPGFNLVAQVSRNKLMHTINGNTTSVLLLDYLIPPPMPIQICRTTLLQYRISPPPGLPQPLLPLTTGEWAEEEEELMTMGYHTFLRLGNLASIGTRDLEFIGIYRIRTFPLMPRSPPPRGTPGALPGRTKRDPTIGEVSMAPCRGPANGAIAAGHTAAGAGKPKNTCRRGRTPFRPHLPCPQKSPRTTQQDSGEKLNGRSISRERRSRLGSASRPHRL